MPAVQNSHVPLLMYIFAVLFALPNVKIADGRAGLPHLLTRRFLGGKPRGRGADQ